MENTEMLGMETPNISPRANALAIQNNIDIRGIIPTGPEGRIIENDILLAIEKRNQPKTPEVLELPHEIVSEVTAKPALEELIPAEAPAADEVMQTEEPVNTEDTVQQDDHTDTPEEETDEPEIEIIEEGEQEATEEEAASEEEPVKEEKTEETAIVAAPVTAIANEEKAEEAKEKETISEKTFRSEDAYRHTDVIISQSDKAPDATPITIEMSFDATAVTTLREKIKENGDMMNLPSVTINDMILFAVTKTLKKHKAMNAHFLGDKIRYFDGIHLGFAIDTERGPKTLTVFDADRLSLSSLSKITGTLIRGIRAGGEAPEKNLRMGSFTVTNVGTLGVERFTPVLTEPQTGVLGVSALTTRVKNLGNEDVTYPCIPLALTFDPRAMSTANAAKFLRDLCFALENFGLLLMK